MAETRVRLITTCPVVSKLPGREYLDLVARVSRWADEDGWEATLVYTDNKQADPWVLAHFIIEQTQRLTPLVATQPIYSHPFAVAKTIASIHHFYGRRVYLNMVAGGFPRDLATLCDTTPHDRRYDRVIEYTTIIQALLTKGSITMQGSFYKVKDLQLPALPADKNPLYTLSGSSPAGQAAAKRLGAVAVQYLRPANEYTEVKFNPLLQHGTRVGLIVRNTSGEAWDAARRRFPDDADGQQLRKAAASLSDSVWVKELDREVRVPEGHPYWLGPYKNSQSSAPFLVGDMDQVVSELAQYIRLGLGTFLLEAPSDREDSTRITEVFRRAQELAERPAA